VCGRRPVALFSQFPNGAFALPCFVAGVVCMKTLNMRLAATLCCVAFSVPQGASAYTTSAATGAVLIAPGDQAGSFSATIAPGSFSDTFTFSLPRGAYSISAVFSSSSIPSSAALHFTSVTLDGHAFALTSQTANLGFTTLGFTSGGVSNVYSTGVNSLTFTGTAPAAGSLSGSLAIAAVPEPAQWAFMIAGVGAIALACQAQRRRALLCKRASIVGA